MATTPPVLMSGIGADCVMQPGQKDDILCDLKRVLGDRPVEFLRPRRVRHNPVTWLVPRKEIATVPDFAPIARLGEIIVECAVAPAGIENPACWTEMVDQPSGQRTFRIHEIVDDVPYQRGRCLSRVIVASLGPLVIDTPDPTLSFNPCGNLIRTDCVTVLAPLVKYSGHHDGCAVCVATDAKTQQIAANRMKDTA